MVRTVLDNVGFSLALALLCFVYLPVLLRDNSLNRRLLVAATVVFVAALALSFSLRLTAAGPLLVWHLMSFALCSLAVDAVTMRAPKIFDAFVFRAVAGLLFLPLTVILISGISHSIHVLMLFPGVMSPGGR
jgi:hypothetical protein